MSHKKSVLFFSFVLYKLALDFAYWKITSIILILTVSNI